MPGWNRGSECVADRPGSLRNHPAGSPVMRPDRGGSATLHAGPSGTCTCRLEAPMALLEDVLENSLPGVVIGAVAATILLPVLGMRRAAAGAAGATAVGGGIARPLVKAAVRGYL